MDVLKNTLTPISGLIADKVLIDGTRQTLKILTYKIPNQLLEIDNICFKAENLSLIPMLYNMLMKLI